MDKVILIQFEAYLRARGIKPETNATKVTNGSKGKRRKRSTEKRISETLPAEKVCSWHLSIKIVRLSARCLGFDSIPSQPCDIYLQLVTYFNEFINATYPGAKKSPVEMVKMMATPEIKPDVTLAGKLQSLPRKFC